MPVKTWTVTDVEQDVHLDSLGLGPSDLGLIGCSIRKERLRGGLNEGVDVIRVDNGRLSFDVVPTRGMSIHRAWLDGFEIGWKSPVRGPLHPSFVPLMEPAGLGWLDGFDELLVRCGLESNGPPLFNDKNQLTHPLHGRIGNRPAHRVVLEADSDTGEIRVTGVVEETRFHFLKLRLTATIATKIGQPSLRIHDEVENFSASPAEMQMLYHINFGEPLLDEGSRFVSRASMISPRDARAAEGMATWDQYAGPVAGFAEQVYFLELLADKDSHRTQTLLKNAAGTRGVGLKYDLRQLPCFTLWKNTTASADGYVTGLEPGTNFPNPRPIEAAQGHVVKLGPGARTAFDLELEIYSTAAEVTAAESAVKAIRWQKNG